MLRITVPGVESFDDAKQEFVSAESVTLELEHSLASLSVWESKWEVAFLGPTPKSTEQTLDYVRCMTLTVDVSPEVYSRLSNENIEAINEYINAKKSATTFHDVGPKRQNSEFITSELIYYWLVALNIPFETQYWHLNRLLTLVKVVNLKSQPAKKMGRAEAAAQRRMLNEQRQRQFGTTG